MNRIRPIFAVMFVGLALLPGCGRENPGTWSQEQVSAKIAESMQLSDVELTPSSEGFTGTGKRSDGETMTVTITQDADNHRISWEAKGDRGSIEDGVFELR